MTKTCTHSIALIFRSVLCMGHVCFASTLTLFLEPQSINPNPRAIIFEMYCCERKQQNTINIYIEC